MGKHSFEPKILDGVVIPSLGYPSFSYLNVTEIDFDEKYIGKTCFNIVLVRIPPCEADYTPEVLEKTLKQFVKSGSKSIYIGFPWQLEALPLTFEDDAYSYNLYEDKKKGMYIYDASEQRLKERQFDSMVKRSQNKL